MLAAIQLEANSEWDKLDKYSFHDTHSFDKNTIFILILSFYIHGNSRHIT